MVSKDLKNLLESLDLLSNDAVFFRDEKDGTVFPFATEIQKKLDIIMPDAFFVFNKIPYLLFFDLTGSEKAEREPEIHKQVWSFDCSPVIFIVKKNEIQIFNAFNYNKKLKQLEKIDNRETQQFSFWNLQSGESWKWLQASKYLSNIQKKRVNQKLFENIKEIREQLKICSETEDGLSDDNANIFILRITFIRYLIDRNVEIDNQYINGNNPKEKRISFDELLQNGDLLKEFFKYLNRRFNGVLFKDVDIVIPKSKLEFIYNIFDSRENKRTPSLFKKFYFDIFDFAIIPVEVISGIYESLISPETRNEHSAIYTPSFLVEYILAETVDKYLEENNTSECKVFDPACGSGIFLVQALRRMIDKEIKLYDNRIKSKEFNERIREIAINNLFGIDINLQALKVTCFSIYIALLDYQEPKDIDIYEFPNFINEHFFESNFFETNPNQPLNTVIKNIDFNFILGNPPWKNGEKDTLHKKYLIDNHLLEIISDYQLAQSFIIRTKDFTNSSTICTLIVTSKAIYNSNAMSFKKYFLKNFFLYKCFDLSAISNAVFEKAINPAMILTYKYSTNVFTLNNIVKHESVKQNYFIKYSKILLISKNDRKEIKQFYFHEYSWMFKVALYGGTLDYILLNKLDSIKINIGHIANNQDKVFSGDGIKRLTDLGKSKLKNPAVPFSEIKDIPIVETSNINKYYTHVDIENKLTNVDLFVKSGNNINLYLGDRILFKAVPIKSHSEIVFTYIEGNSVYREKTLGISSQNNINKLKEIYALILSKLFTYYQFLTSSSWGIFFPEILHKEYLSFPYKEFGEYSNKLNELVGKLLKFFKENNKPQKGENLQPDENIIININNIINTTYKLSSYDIDLIDYVHNVSRYQFQGDERLTIKNNFTTLDENHYRHKKFVMNQYADVFIKEFEKIYTDEYIQVEVYTLHHFIAMNFVFLKEKPDNKPQVDLKPDSSDIRDLFNVISGLSVSNIASSSNQEHNLFIQKDIKGFEAKTFYEKNTFYIIKPAEYKCWHRAMAWYDVSEIKESIQKAELDYLRGGINGF